MTQQEKSGFRNDEKKKILAALKGDIDIPDPETELSRLSKKIDRHEMQRTGITHFYYGRHNRIIGAVAAGVLILISVVSSFVIFQDYHTEPAEQELTIKETFQEYDFATNYGEKRTFTLSDGSTIILNANSHLSFSSNAGQQGVNTEVWLQGEAYFDIAHLEGEQERIFTVHTPDGSVEVLGTRFVVSTYDKKTQAILEEGQIAIKLNGSKPKKYYLNPGSMAEFESGAKSARGITIREVNTRIYTDWTEDKMVFDETPLCEVGKRIEQYYGIKVIINDEFSDKVLSGSIKAGNLDVIVEALKKVLETSKITLQGNNNNKKMVIG